MIVFIVASIRDKQIYQILGVCLSLEIAQQLEAKFTNNKYPIVIIAKRIITNLNKIMYKIIVMVTNKIKETNTFVFTYFDLEYCEKQIIELKDKYLSMGCTIHELKVFKVEQINVPEQI